MWIELEILKNRAKLERMIMNDEDYDKILEQSRKLDDYINIKIREQTDAKESENCKNL